MLYQGHVNGVRDFLLTINTFGQIRVDDSGTGLPALLSDQVFGNVYPEP